MLNLIFHLLLLLILQIWCISQVFGFHLYEFEGKSGFYVLQNQIGVIKGVSPQDPSEANTILFLILSTICLSDGEIMEGEKFYDFIFLVEFIFKFKVCINMSLQFYWLS